VVVLFHVQPSGNSWRFLLAVLLGWSIVVDRTPGAEPKAVVPAQKIVFFGGVKTHPPGAHEHLEGAKFLKRCIDAAPNVTRIDTNIYLDCWPQDTAELDAAATIVLVWEGWDQHLISSRHQDRVRTLQRLMHRGVGLVCLHAATAVEDDVESYFLEWIGGNKKPNYSQHWMAQGLKFALATPAHPICRGVRPMQFAEEEFYSRIFFRPDDPRVTPVLTAMLPPEQPAPEVVAWTCQRADGGRGFACTGPHYHASFANDDLRRLVLNAILWTAKIEVPQGGVHSTALP
jgi:type 1 glutamine amidotransferase